MRAALLPTPGDPFMLAYWLRNFETWKQQVDELVVFVNGANPTDEHYLRRLVEDAGGKFSWLPQMVGHDRAMLWLLQNTDAEYVVMCEDDAYVRNPGAVGAAFEQIENGEVDIVGSPRHEDYADSPLQEWGPYTPGDLAELRHGLWPAFLFIRRAEMLDTDRVFGDRAWPLGAYVDGWGPVSREACQYVGIADSHIHLDTLFGTTFQLRAKGLTVDLVHHVRLFDASATEQWIVENPPWFHVTNLSTLDVALGAISLDSLPDLDEHGGLWTRRMAWWLRTTSGPGESQRREKLLNFAQRTGMTGAALEAWQARFDMWVTWDESAAEVLV